MDAHDELRMEAREVEESEATREALDDMRRNGSNLSAPRQVEFFSYFADELSATRAAQEMASRRYPTTVYRVEEGDPSFTCISRRRMVLSEGSLGLAMQELEEIAERFGGELDGWETEPGPMHWWRAPGFLVRQLSARLRGLISKKP